MLVKENDKKEQYKVLKTFSVTVGEENEQGTIYYKTIAVEPNEIGETISLVPTIANYINSKYNNTLEKVED